MHVERAKIGPASATKSFEKRIIRLLMVKDFKRGFVMQLRRWKSVNEVDNGEESIGPVLKGSRGMGEKCKTGFSYMTMFTLNYAILLVRIWARKMM